MEEKGIGEERVVEAEAWAAIRRYVGTVRYCAVLRGYDSDSDSPAALV